MQSCRNQKACYSKISNPGAFYGKPCLSEMGRAWEYFSFFQLNAFFPCSCCFDAPFSHKLASLPITMAYISYGSRFWSQQRPGLCCDKGWTKIGMLPCHHELWQAVLSPSHSFPLLDLSHSTATGRFWVLPQVSVLTPPRENVV